MTRIKICGLTSEKDVCLCAALGADALGFVVEYPLDVPWNIDRRKARDLLSRVPPFIFRVIVVGDDPQTVMELISLLRPHAVQLHGNEPLSITANLVIAAHAQGVQVIKALRLSVETGECLTLCKDPFDAAKRIKDTGVDALVVDSVSKARPAGTGRIVDWGMTHKICDIIMLPVILAGGLNPENVGWAMNSVNPHGVDVISGVEAAVGVKDANKVRSFIKAVRMFG